MLKFKSLRVSKNVLENLKEKQGYNRETIVKAGPKATMAPQAIEKNHFSERFIFYKERAESLLEKIAELEAKFAQTDKQIASLHEKIQSEKTEEEMRKEMQNIFDKYKIARLACELELQQKKDHLEKLYELEQQVSLNIANNKLTGSSNFLQKLLASPNLKKKNEANMEASGTEATTVAEQKMLVECSDANVSAIAVNGNGTEGSKSSLLQQINAAKAAMQQATKAKMQNNDSTQKTSLTASSNRVNGNEILDPKIGIGSKNDELNSALAKRRRKLEQNATESVIGIDPILAVTREQPNQSKFSAQQKEILVKEKSSPSQKKIMQQPAKMTKSGKYTDLTTIGSEVTANIQARAEKTLSLVEFEELEKQLLKEKILESKASLQMQELDSLLHELEQYSSIPDAISSTSNEILNVFCWPLSTIQEEEESEKISEYVEPVELKKSTIEELSKSQKNESTVLNSDSVQKQTSVSVNIKCKIRENDDSFFKNKKAPPVPPKPKNKLEKTELSQHSLFQKMRC